MLIGRSLERIQVPLLTLEGKLDGTGRRQMVRYPLLRWLPVSFGDRIVELRGTVAGFGGPRPGLLLASSGVRSAVLPRRDCDGHTFMVRPVPGHRVLPAAKTTRADDVAPRSAACVRGTQVGDQRAQALNPIRSCVLANVVLPWPMPTSSDSRGVPASPLPLIMVGVGDIGTTASAGCSGEFHARCPIRPRMRCAVDLASAARDICTRARRTVRSISARIAFRTSAGMPPSTPTPY